MRLRVDTSDVQFMVTREAEPKVDQQGQQQYRKSDSAPMWRTQVTALDESGGEVILITTAGVKPETVRGQLVHPVALEAIPWNTNGRNGVAYRAEELQVLPNGAES